MYKRSTDLSRLSESFFLWGPRQVGKSSLLRKQLPDAFWVDLLRADEFMKYSTEPHRLREELARWPKDKWVVIDEVQKVPALLDEVHGLIESRRLRFALCGSSARKLRRGHANLLGGRALRRELLSLTAQEVGSEFDLERALNQGGLPAIYSSENPRDKLRSYCADYLKEEIAAEGLVRNLPAFHRFLEGAAISDTEQLNFATMARDLGVSGPTVKSYFEILEDTLLGKMLPAYRHRPKRRLELTPKFYFFDVGVAGYLARRGHVARGSELFGKSLEGWIHHELRAYQAYRNPDLELSYWRTSTQLEVDFIVGKMDCAIEVKGTDRIRSDHLRGLKEVAKDYPQVRRRMVVCCESRPRITEDNIEILPWRHFLQELASGKLLR